MRALLALILSCGGGPDPASRAAARERAALALAAPRPSGPARAQVGPVTAARAGARAVQAAPVLLDLAPGFPISAIWLLPEGASDRAVLVAHGHYGQGKNSAEAQEIAWDVVASGVPALLVDTPGVEEGDLPALRLHFEEGAHNRGYLVAGGSSALGVQIAALQRALDWLETQGIRRIAATGASGGAVQSFYLGLVDPRVAGVALASFPPIPREARAGGCACDLLPGLTWPDPGLLGALEVPSLWMSEVAQDRPEGLPRSATFEVLAGDHSYTPAMRARALAWLGEVLDVRVGAPLDPPQALELHTTLGAVTGIPGLALAPRASWTPQPHDGPPLRVQCQGRGPAVLVGGGEDPDLAALQAVGLRPCLVAEVDPDPVGVEAGWATGQPYADGLAGALRAAAAREHAVGAYAVRGWAVPLSAAGLTWVARDPLRTYQEVDPARDPLWIHVPGVWWGGMDGLLAGARAVGDDPEALAAALAPK